NRGEGTFEDRAFVEGLDAAEETCGLAFADLDGDGAPEVLVSSSVRRVLLYENHWGASSGGRVRVLLGRTSGTNRDAIGAVVRLTASGKTQLREVRAGSSYLSQSSRELFFGIGASARAERVEVRWPDGKSESLADVPAGSRVVWMEGTKPEILTGTLGARLPR
ncbi:MAG TPA: CRTAC1 family protein, partial [Thermoanaerobaculia bacterium]|nr:CRTAC1 family protein [Thermoanaerobaculia bacterium]